MTQDRRDAQLARYDVHGACAPGTLGHYEIQTGNAEGVYAQSVSAASAAPAAPAAPEAGK